jgi:tryptophan halogenase
MTESAATDRSMPLRVVIVGGGTAGWMTAAGLLGLLGKAHCSVRLVESDEIGIVGVGEATLPQLRQFNRAIGVIESEMMRRTFASFKLGIEFRDWGYQGSRYIHPFGAFGHPIGGIPFHQHWRRAALAGDESDIADYSYAIVAAREHRFDFPSEDNRRIESTYDYAYHIDASLYARYLRTFCERRGAVRTEGKVIAVALDGENGLVRSIALASGEQIDGDLFVDCSGFRALLIGGELDAEWEDWSHWLPCDRAVAVPSERTDDLHPFTRVTAREAGWQWRIPLQHRTGNGYVFSSALLDEDRAAETLLASLDGLPLAEPRLLKFKAGRRVEGWKRNCVAIGLSSGFLEPLESTSIYLIQRAVEYLVRLFPSRNVDAALPAEFNRLMDVEYARIRDFLILHYHLNARDDSDLWRQCRAMTVPESLKHKIQLFRNSGQIEQYRDGLFSPPSWLSVLIGQGLVPQCYHALADATPLPHALAEIEAIRTAIRERVETMPSHAEALDDIAPFDPSPARVSA